MLTEIAIAIDGDPVQKDLYGLICCGEEEALIHARIRRNVDTNPDMVRPLRNSNTKLRIEFSPMPLILWKCRDGLRSTNAELRRIRLPIFP